MLSVMGRISALTFGILALSAHATAELSGQSQGVSVRDSSADVLFKRSEDCDFANLQWADVDCYYDFDKGGNFLNYVVKIQPTGQANTGSGWCKGIIDNMIGECGRNPSDNTAKGNGDYSHCNDYLEYNLHHPKTKEVRAVKGIDFNFHYQWPWTEGSDARDCITSAIKKGTCWGGITFTNGGCYKRGTV